MSVTLFGYWRSLAAFRVRVALNLKEVEFQEIMIDLAAGQQFEADFDELNPQHVVPLLIHDQLEISQSMAILEYIDEQWANPKLLPEQSFDKAKVRALALVTIADTHPLIVPRVRKLLGSQWALDEHQQFLWAQHWFTIGNMAIEKILIKEARSKMYAYGDELTIADIALASHAIGATLFKVDMALTPTFANIFSNCMAIPAFAKAHPLKQSGAPQSI
jgi:maleylacetoacetate isomerase